VIERWNESEGIEELTGQSSAAIDQHTAENGIIMFHVQFYRTIFNAFIIVQRCMRHQSMRGLDICPIFWHFLSFIIIAHDLNWTITLHRTNSKIYRTSKKEQQSSSSHSTQDNVTHPTFLMALTIASLPGCLIVVFTILLYGVVVLQ
jgi:hypothetical protein